MNVGNILSILLTKDGFSFCVFKEGKRDIYENFSLDLSSGVSMEDSIHQQIKDNLYWKQEYKQVKVVVINEQFNIVPNEYFSINPDIEEWIAFNANLFEGDSLHSKALDNYEAQFLYGYSQEIKNVLTSYFKEFEVTASGILLLNHIKSESEEPELFINLNLSCLEILCVSKDALKFYNHFKVNTKEDILYYILNVYKQLDLDPNKNKLYYFGAIQDKEKLLKMLLNFVRHVIPGTDQKETLEHFTHYKNVL